MAPQTVTRSVGAGVDMTLIGRVESSGVTLTREGNIWVGACPFHDDPGKSLLIDPSSNHWQCDGECQTGGSIVEWVIKTEHVSRSHAMELLRHDAPASSLTEHETERTTVRKLDAPFGVSDDDRQILHHVIDYYHETLKQSPEALSYLQKRGIDRTEAIEHFKLGFSNRTLGYRLPEKNRKTGAALRGCLQRLGILRASGHEYFRGSVVFPVINAGRIRQVYGRKVGDHHRAGTPLHTYLREPHQGIFNLEAVQVSDELVLCPSVIDALTFWCAGFQQVTASYGIEGFTDAHLAAFKQYAVKRVLIAYAADEPGDTAAVTLADQLTVAGIDTYRIEFPRRLDANAYAAQATSAALVLGDAIRKAVWLGKGKAPRQLRGGVAVPDDSDIEAEIPCDHGVLQPDAEEDALTEGQEGTEDAVVDVLPDAGADADADLENDAPLPARVEPLAPVEVEAEVKDKEVIITLGDRRYRIRGLDRNLSFDQLKVNILVSRQAALHVDTFNLYATRPRSAFIRQAAIELGTSDDLIKQDMGKLLLKLEVLQDTQIRQTLTQKPAETPLSQKDRTEALALLKSPRLMDRILDDFQCCGVIGERTNKLVGYLAALSRKLDKPLAIMIQSTSAAGKSALMDAVLAFIPDEDRHQYSAMTGQSLFYMGNIDLRHKILAISEEEGASHAAYALKLLQSNGQLTIASTGKDANTGRHVTHEYKVEGPVMIFSTTTAIDIDEELLNRCLVLTVDEDREQTQAIHDWQRFEETLDGLLATQARDAILTVHRNAQRLLKPLKVVNPYAQQLTFLSDKTRTRRDHTKYLTLIRSIALLHQYQREIKTAYVRDRTLLYIEVTLDDIAMANQIAHEVLGRSLDELPPQTRRLLQLVDQMVAEHCHTHHLSRCEYRFGRRAIRAYTGWGNTQLKVHLQRLETMEYLLRLRGGRGQPIVYELLYSSEGQDGGPFMMGLRDVDGLDPGTADPESMADVSSEADRPLVGRVSGTGQSSKTATNINTDKCLRKYEREIERNPSQRFRLPRVHTLTSTTVPTSNQ